MSACLPTARNDYGRVENYSGEFEYRYADRDATSAPPSSDGGWQPMRSLGTQPGRRWNSVLWLRTCLTGAAYEPATLSLRIVAHEIKAFLDEQPVELISDGTGSLERRLRTRGEYVLPLPRGYQGRLLMLRLAADSPMLGLEARPRIGTAQAVVSDIITRNIDYLFVTVVLTLTALLGIALFFIDSRQRIYLCFAGASLFFGLSAFGFSTIGGILLGRSFPSAPLQILGNALGNLFLLWFLRFLINAGPLRIGDILRGLWLLDVAAYAAAAKLWPDRIVFLVLYAHNLIAALTLVGLVATAVHGTRRGHTEARLFSLNLLATLVFAAPEILILLKLRSGASGRFHSPTILVFLLGLALILIRRFFHSHRQHVRLQVEHQLATLRLHEQESLLLATDRMAKGELEQPIAAHAESPLANLAASLDDMRKDVRDKLRQLEEVKSDLHAKVVMLESRNRDIGQLNDELRRQIEQRSRRLLDELMSSAPRPAILSPELSEGELLGTRYRVIRRIGQGGMGTVYEVSRIPDQQRFAAKILRRMIVARTALGRFAREAQIMARVQHPNLVSIWDVDVSDTGRLYLILDFIDGRPLSAYRERQVDRAWTYRVLCQVAEGLRAIHQAGVVHRDLKPDNILIIDSPAGPQVKLADFGISRMVSEPAEKDGGKKPQSETLGDESAPVVGRRAPDLAHARTADGSPSLTETGVLMGTPGYIAPEVLVSARSAQQPADLYAWGIIAVQLLAGPSAVRTEGSPLQKALTPPDPQRALRDAQVEPKLAALILRCLDENPAKRPSTDELIAVLGTPFTNGTNDTNDTKSGAREEVGTNGA